MFIVASSNNHQNKNMDDEKMWDEMYENQFRHMCREWPKAFADTYRALFSQQELHCIDTLTSEGFNISELLVVIPNFKERLIVWLKEDCACREKRRLESVEKIKVRMAELETERKFADVMVAVRAVRLAAGMEEKK